MPDERVLTQNWRDIWSYGSSNRLPDLISSALALLLVLPPTRPTYFASPYISDFDLFNNEARGFSSLVPTCADQSHVSFKQFLIRLSESSDVRIITTQSETTVRFFDDERLRASSVQVQFGPDTTHEKGILADSFYLEGSMNLTHMGARINGEKVTYYASGTKSGAEKIANAYIEFNRKWQNLQSRHRS